MHLRHLRLSALLCWLLLSWSVVAQDAKLPLDPAVRQGKLPNGITYYLRQNAMPEKKLELRLAINAGSMQEDEDQLGLAHFTEHMCFNGSKNFKKNELVSYLQSIGVEFGGDLNAYTSFDETVYILPIPTDKPGAVDKGFQVLEDWAHQVSFEGEEIDKERGVIIEEWRLGQGADQRMRDRYFPVIFKNSRYADRLPIGKKEIIESFPHEVIRRFYRDWYRPDLTAVIVVGDMSLDEMEAKVKKHFSDIKPVANPRKKTEYEVPDHAETLVAVEKDKEASNIVLQLMYKHPAEKLETEADYRRQVLYSLYNGMVNNRLNELRQSANPPFVFAGTDYSAMVRTKNAYSSYAVVGDKGIERGLRAIVEENERIRRFGFTAGELDRYKKQYIAVLERAYNERTKTESEQYASEYVSLFLEGEAAPGIAAELEMTKKYLPAISVEEINALAKKWITDQNRVVLVTGPDKASVEYPSKERILQILGEAAKADLKGYEDKKVATALMEKAPQAGKIVAEKKLADVGVTELTLSNGAKVILKKTDFKNDEILFNAFSFGGHSLVSDNDYYSGSYASQIVASSGVGNISPLDMPKVMSGKLVRVAPFVSAYEEGLNGSSTPKDLADLFQLTHLYFTQPRRDEAAYQSLVTRTRDQLKNLMANPQFYFSDQYNRLLNQNHPRGGYFPTEEDFAKINLDRSLAIYKERFADASGFTFVFVGNFDEAAIRPLIETYLASLPATKAKESYKNLGITRPSGVVKKEFFKGTDPKSLVNIVFHGDAKYKSEDNLRLRALAQVLDIKLIESLREEAGGVYGVGASSSFARVPAPYYTFNISFPCGPDNVTKLSGLAMSEVDKLRKSGPTEEDLKKVKETMLNQYREGLKENRFWLNNLSSIYKFKGKPADILKGAEQIEALSIPVLQKTAGKYLLPTNYVQAVLMPEKP